MTQLEHKVSKYDAQRESMTLVSGFQVMAEVTVPSGRKFTPVLIAICPSEDDAEEIADLLNLKYSE